MAKEEKYDLWFSKKQRKLYDKKGIEKSFGLLEDGRVVEYTEAVPVGGELPTAWEDFKYLGVGNYHYPEPCDKKTK